MFLYVADDWELLILGEPGLNKGHTCTYSVPLYFNVIFIQTIETAILTTLCNDR